LAEEIMFAVKDGYFRNKTEAINEGMRYIARRYRLDKTRRKMEALGKGKKNKYSSKELIESMHEEEDE